MISHLPGMGSARPRTVKAAQRPRQVEVFINENVNQETKVCSE